jgi:hypothetical protein
MKQGLYANINAKRKRIAAGLFKSGKNANKGPNFTFFARNNLRASVSNF